MRSAGMCDPGQDDSRTHQAPGRTLSAGWSGLSFVVLWGLIVCAGSVLLGVWAEASLGFDAWIWAVGALTAMGMALAGAYWWRAWDARSFLASGLGAGGGILLVGWMSEWLSGHFFGVVMVCALLVVPATGTAVGMALAQWLGRLAGRGGARIAVSAVAGGVGAALVTVGLSAAHASFVSHNDMGGFMTLAIIYGLIAVWAGAVPVVVTLGHLERRRRVREGQGGDEGG